MDIAALENMLDTMLAEGRDSTLLRLGLATAMQKNGALGAALNHLQAAVELDPDFTAAWKALGKVQLELGARDSARQAWQQGIAVASKRGDKQAQKEMQVFLKRLDKPAEPLS